MKTQKGLTVTKTKKKKLETRVQDTERKLQSNTQSLDRVKEEMTSLVASSKELEDDVTNCQSHLKAELECAELRRQCRYFTKYAQTQEKDAQATERYICMNTLFHYDVTACLYWYVMESRNPIEN